MARLQIDKPLYRRDALRKFMDREARVWGGRVESRRKSQKLTLEHLAKLADTTPQTIFKIERGDIVPRDDLRIAIAMALSCEVDALFPMPKRQAIARDVA